MVCTGNICRSPMAEGLLNHYLPAHLKERVAVASAGTSALHGNQAHAHAITAMDKIGIDIRAHRARQLTRRIARDSDLILVMEEAHMAIVRRFLGWGDNKPRMISEFNPRTPPHDIRDPYGDPPDAYDTCIKTLRPCIGGVMLWLGGNLQ